MTIAVITAICWPLMVWLVARAVCVLHHSLHPTHTYAWHGKLTNIGSIYGSYKRKVVMWNTANYCRHIMAAVLKFKRPGAPRVSRIRTTANSTFQQAQNSVVACQQSGSLRNRRFYIVQTTDFLQLIAAHFLSRQIP